MTMPTKEEKEQAVLLNRLMHTEHDQIGHWLLTISKRELHLLTATVIAGDYQLLDRYQLSCLLMATSARVKWDRR